MIEENLHGGEYRKQIYKAIQETIKRDLTENEHKYLSSILKAYVNSERVKTTVVSNQAPVKHIWTCNGCGEVIETVGRKETDKFKKKIKIRNKVNEK